MTNFIVHLYREMKLSYTGIEADSPEAAAAIASEKLTADADNIEDCDGQDLSALVDVAGDEDYSQSVTIDFEPERIRKAATKLLEPLLLAALYIQYVKERTLELHCEAAGSPSIEHAVTSAIIEAESAGMLPVTGIATPPARFEFTHEPQDTADRAYVMVDGKYDVYLKRTAEGVVIDVYPKDWIDPIDSLTVWDDEVAEALVSAEANNAGEV